MIAAIYARKPTEQTDVSAAANSVTGPIECAKASAARKGWTVAGEPVYIDDSMSGAAFENRPGASRPSAERSHRSPQRGRDR
jgi:DNA invertase Pin-like site-specific DNA recombinase